KICETVLSLPILLAANTTPSPEATKRKPVIANSLLIITITIQAGAICNSISIIKAADTSNLSANGSKNFPIFVIRLYFLAMYPSNQYVNDEKINIITAPNCVTGSELLPIFISPQLKSIVNIISINGIKKILDTVILFDKFTLKTPR